MPANPARAGRRLQSERQIIQAALDIVERSGVERLTMRGLAAHLGVAPMSIYWYVPNKDALLDRLCDEVVASVQAPAPGDGQWDDLLFTLSRDTWLAMSRHPGLASIAIERAPTDRSPQSVRLLDAATAILRSAGYDDAGAARAALSALVFVEGHVQYSARSSGKVARRTVGASDHPWFRALAAAPVEPLQLFEYGFRRLLDGLRVELAGGPPG